MKVHSIYARDIEYVVFFQGRGTLHYGRKDRRLALLIVGKGRVLNLYLDERTSIRTRRPCPKPPKYVSNIIAAFLKSSKPGVIR